MRRHLKLPATLLIAAATACASSSTAPRFGDALTMRIGASVRMPNDTSSVQFTDVTADSRCPQGAQCVWEGDAAVVFTVAGAFAATLHTASVGGPTTLITNGKRLTLVSLAPATTLNHSITKSDYVVTIRFDEAKD